MSLDGILAPVNRRWLTHSPVSRAVFGDDMDAGGPAGGGDDALLPENDGDQEDVEYVVGAGGRLKRKRPRKRAKVRWFRALRAAATTLRR